MRPIDKSLRIEGNQIYLRPITLDDTDMVVKWRNSPEVMKNFIFRTPLTRKMHIDWFHNKIEQGLVYQFIICDKSTNQPLGSVYLQNFEEQHYRAEEGIFLGEEAAHGKGIGTEAAKLLIKYAFEVLGLHKLTARVLAYNLASAKMHERAGYIKESYLKDELFLDGRFEDLVFYGIINTATQK